MSTIEKIRREAEESACAFDIGITSRRQALTEVGNLLAAWERVKEIASDVYPEWSAERLHAQFWARVHRSFDLLRFPDTDRTRYLDAWADDNPDVFPDELWAAHYRPTPIATTDEALEIEEATLIQKLAREAGFARRDTGGGFEAWERDLDGDFFVRITAGEDRLFGDTDAKQWIVGLWDRDSGWVCDFVENEESGPCFVIDFEPEVAGAGPMPFDSALAWAAKAAIAVSVFAAARAK